MDDSGSVVVLFPHTQSGGVADVERIDQFSFYNLGRALKAVANFQGGQIHPASAFTEIWTAQTVITDLLGGKPIPITVSRARATAVKSQLDAILQNHFYEPDAQGKPQWKFPDASAAPINSWSWDFLRSALVEFETVFSDEMREATTYFVPRRGIFWTPSLVDAADESFPDEIRGALPEKTRTDWKAPGAA